MSKNDELDRRRAAAFAWRFIRPGEAVVLPEDDPEDNGDHAPAQEKAAREVAAEQEDAAEQESAAPPGLLSSPRNDTYVREVKETCAVFAVDIERVWCLPEGEQAVALEPLLLRANALGLGLCAMKPYSCQSIRLLRLALRCRSELSPKAWKFAGASTTWLDYQHPELVELLVEVARAGALSFVVGLMLAVSEDRWSAVARTPGAIARIAQIIDEGPSYASRCIAATWISRMGGYEAVPALRRALRAPHFVLRYQALEALSEHFPDMIQPEDVVFLVEDAVLHAPPDYLRHEEAQRASLYLPGTLEEAVVRLRPKDAIEPLVCLIEDRCAPRWPVSSGLNAAWALNVLAAAFPEEAVPHIDRLLAHVSWDKRDMATEAAGSLPDALAKPRLLTAAADPVPEIAERAQAIWLQRYATLCPLDPMAGVETVILEGPPSEVMRSRLALLRRGPLEARAAMVEFLLGQAPDPEALALLIFAVSDSRLWEYKPRPGLPNSHDSFCRVLIEGFGTRAVDGLLALSTRFPEGRGGWLSALATLLTLGVISKDSYPAMRAAVAHRIATLSRDQTPEYDVIMVLSYAGPPLELAGRLWELARDPVVPSYIREVARHALVHLPGEDPDLAAAVEAEMDATLAAADLTRFALAVSVGFARKLPRAVTLAERTLFELGPRPPTEYHTLLALTSLAEDLGVAGRLPDTFLLDALGRPGTYLCAVATRRLHYCALTEPEIEALRVVLAGDDATCAVGAACALLIDRVIGPEHPGLTALAARAPLVHRSELVFRLWARGAPLNELWPLLEPLLISADPDVTEPVKNFTHEMTKAGLTDKLRTLMPHVVDPVLRMDIENLFSLEAEAFWEDREDEG